MFSIVYAVPCGGRRQFDFDSAELLAEHVSRNRPGFFAGLPDAFSDEYDETIEHLQRSPYRLPQEKKT